jgi:hypothetical protein
LNGKPSKMHWWKAPGPHKDALFSRKGCWSGGLDRVVESSSFSSWVILPNGDNGCRSCGSGAVVRGGTSDCGHRR